MQANGIRIDSTVREHAVLTMGMSTLEITLVESDRDRASVTLQMETCMLVIGRRTPFMDLGDIIIIMAIGTLMFDHSLSVVTFDTVHIFQSHQVVDYFCFIQLRGHVSWR